MLQVDEGARRPAAAAVGCAQIQELMWKQLRLGLWKPNCPRPFVPRAGSGTFDGASLACEGSAVVNGKTYEFSGTFE
jgi:hypothetical protein